MSQQQHKALFALGTLALTSVALMGASGGSCVGAFGKINGAVMPIASSADPAVLAKCGTFSNYQATVEPVFQRTCVACHGPGGKGAAHWQIGVGDATNILLAAGNYSIAKVSAMPMGTADLTDLENTSPLLERVNGKLTHDLTLSVFSDDYQALYAWVSGEVSTPCVIDPATGQITSGGVSP